jgi:hypothetical protein
MTGSHRAIQETNKARVAVAGALTAGALLLAPVGAVIAAPGIAHAERPGGGTGDPGGPAGGGTDGGGGTQPPGGGPGNPGGPDAGNPPGTGGGAHKQIIRLPGLKIEIKNIRGDHKPPTIKFVPFPRLTNR